MMTLAKVLSFAVLAALATQVRPTGHTSAEFLLAPGRAGRFSIGMPVDEVYRHVGRERTRLIDLYREGKFDPALEVRLAGAAGPAGLVMPIREWPCIEWSIQGIRVRDPRFRTAEGIGVGSTLGDLSEAYPTKTSEEEGPHAWVESIRMNFGLEDASFAPTAKVTSIWIPGDPVAIRTARCPERGALGG